MLGTAVSLCSSWWRRSSGCDLQLPAAGGQPDLRDRRLQGRGRELERAELAPAVAERLGSAPEAIVREYGMTELTSHFYAGRSAAGLHPFTAPPGCASGSSTRPRSTKRRGAAGLLAVFDLANVGSALHVLTEDLGVAVGDGFHLVGRAAGAELRGCSLLSEELAG